MSNSTTLRRQRLHTLLNVKAGDFVCVNNSFLTSFDMEHPLWQAIGRVDEVRRYSTGYYEYQVLFPSYMPHQFQDQVFASWNIRKAKPQEGWAAFALDQWTHDAKHQAVYDRRFEKAQFEAAKAQVTASDF